jgi:hypothetical protein
MQTSPAVQQRLCVVHAAPRGTHDTHVPPLQTSTDEQHEFPHAVCPWVHAATVVAHVEVEGLAHAVPFWQQAWPHGVVPAGHPHSPADALRQAMPALQQHGPHGVVPAAHGEALTVVGPVQVAGRAA